MTRTKHTNYDFSNHELIVRENDLVKIHILKLSFILVRSIKFINCEGIIKRSN